MTRKIGRYEILGSLATGGMAEILLARLVGPSGFERPVVIKRIRPDLDHTELVSLFLEEGRLAAKVRHANVVAVEDLGTDEGAPYLVMEYLEGESLSNVTRRLVAREETAPFGLIAYIIAEACAGLHAAHELRDQNDELVGLVHRDVSPQNVFVTYDGAVKVVDFGIAKTEASESDTNAIRGKSGYMAPEQLQLEDADRRTDIFALGIVLYELLTGHRLFKRFNQTATIRAVLTDPIIAPSRIEPAVPRELEAICMRALTRPREGRYATAAEMRRELLVAMRDLASEEPSAELAELMVRCFQDRIGEKRVLLNNVREGSVVDHIPEGDIDVTIHIPGIEELPVGSEWGAPGALAPSAPVPVAPAVSVAPGTLDATAAQRLPAPAPRPHSSLASGPTIEASGPSPRRTRMRWLVPVLFLGSVAGASVGLSIRAVQVNRAKAQVATAPLQSSSVSTMSAEAPTASAEPAASATDAPLAAPAEPAGVAAGTASAVPARSSAPAANRRVRPLPTTTPAAPPVTVPTATPPVGPSPTAGVDPTKPAPSSSARGFRRFQ